MNKKVEQANATGTDEETTASAASMNRSYSFSAECKEFDELKRIDDNVYIANCLSASEENSDYFIWYVDSAASEHFVSQRSMLVNIVPLKKPMQIKVAKKREIIIAKEKGDMTFTTTVNGIKTRISFSGILLVPDLNINLL